MSTVTGLTAERMLEIEAASIVSGVVVNGTLYLTAQDGTVFNAGSVLSGTHYRNVIERHGLGTNESAGNIMALMPFPSSLPSDSSNHADRGSMFYIDPADFAMSGKTTKLRIQARVYTNTVGYTGNIRYRLYPVTAVGGASGTLTITRGAMIAGSEALITNPGISARAITSSGDFDAPAAGHYVITVEPVGAAFTNRMLLQAQLQVRNV